MSAEHPMIDPMIEVSHLYKKFRGQAALDGIGLCVAPGESVALVGANGAGKTTLIRCLLGEYRYRGTVKIGGRSPRAERTAVLARVGFVPQLPPPLEMPVAQLLAFASSLCATTQARMLAISDALGFDALAVGRRPFAKLSGGQKQKLLIALALGRDCDLLIMDEPAANLDPEARERFLALLGERRGRATMLLSSHRPDEVATLVDRTIELRAGRVFTPPASTERGASAPLPAEVGA